MCNFLILMLFTRNIKSKIAIIIETLLTPNIRWIIKKAREFQKNIYFCFIDYAKAFVHHNKLWKILKEMGIPEHLTCLLRNLYAGQKATFRTGYGTTNCFQIRNTSRLYIVTLLI